MDMVLEVTVLGVGLAVIALIGIYTLITGSPPTPSSRRARAAMDALMPSDRNGLILELGSGFGGLARMLAEKHPRASVLAYERSPFPWLVSRLWLLIRPQENLRFIRADFRSAPFSEAQTVVCYLLSPIMASLAPVLATHLSSGAIVLACTFALPGWTAAETAEADDFYRSPIYLYRTPESLPPTSHRQE